MIAFRFHVPPCLMAGPAEINRIRRRQRRRIEDVHHLRSGFAIQKPSHGCHVPGSRAMAGFTAYAGDQMQLVHRATEDRRRRVTGKAPHDFKLRYGAIHRLFQVCWRCQRARGSEIEIVQRSEIRCARLIQRRIARLPK